MKEHFCAEILMRLWQVQIGIGRAWKKSMMNGMDTEQQTGAKNQPTCYIGRRIHLIGISGAGMRALGQMLLDRGAILSGSDSAGNGVAERMRERGATVYTSQQAENLPDECDMVVYSAAIDEQNPELLAGGGAARKF